MKISLVICALFSGVIGFGQNIGVGTTAPSAPLHIRSTTAVEMLRIEGLNPYISFFDGPTYSGYLWYNTNRMELGTPLGSGQPVVIAPDRTASTYFTTGGEVGIGTSAPSEKLHVAGNVNINGALKFDGIGGTSGQILTSTGSSTNPVWLSPVRVAFLTESAIPQTIVPLAATGTRLELNAEVFDDGDDFSTTTDAFTAPGNGVYHFSVKVTFFNADPGNYRLYLDNNTNVGDGHYAVYYLENGTDGSASLMLSITMRMNLGQQILAHVWHNAATDQQASFNYFSGYRVY